MRILRNRREGNLQRGHSLAQRGQAVYPQDGIDAEKILSEADKRMYLQKRSQASPKNRRLYPRTRGRLTAEISGDGQKTLLAL